MYSIYFTVAGIFGQVFFCCIRQFACAATVCAFGKKENSLSAFYILMF